MANEGHIIIKTGDKTRKATYRDFYGPLDKGSAKPSFCYPRKKEMLKEEIEKTQKAIDSGFIAKEREMAMKIKLKEKRERLDKLSEQENSAKKLFKENKDAWIARREHLKEEIANNMPTRDAVIKRRVSPHAVLRKEKKEGLEDKKREFVVISRLAEEEPNTAFLQRD